MGSFDGRSYLRLDMPAVPEHDLYAVLGVERTATLYDVDRAFRARARSLHVDVAETPDGAARFAELARAYDILSRPAARLLYDRFGYIEPPSAPGGPAPEPAAAAPWPPPAPAVTLDAAAPAEAAAAAEAVNRARAADANPVDAAPQPRRGVVVDLDVTPIEAQRGTRRRVRGLERVVVPAGVEDGTIIGPEESSVRVRVRIRDRDPRLVRFAAAAGALVAAMLFLALVLSPDAIV